MLITQTFGKPPAHIYTWRIRSLKRIRRERILKCCAMYFSQLHFNCRMYKCLETVVASGRRSGPQMPLTVFHDQATTTLGQSMVGQDAESSKNSPISFSSSSPSPIWQKLSPQGIFQYSKHCHPHSSSHQSMGCNLYKGCVDLSHWSHKQLMAGATPAEPLQPPTKSLLSNCLLCFVFSTFNRANLNVLLDFLFSHAILISKKGFDYPLQSINSF